MLTAILLIVLLLFCVVVAAAILVLDTGRVLTLTDQASWRCQAYRRALPSLLALLSRAKAPLPWPERMSGWSILRFKRTLQRLLRHETGLPRQLPTWHVGFWVHLRQHQPVIDFALSQAILEALPRLDRLAEPATRLRCLEILHRARSRQEQLRPQIEQELGSEYRLAARRLVADLSRIEVIYSEHGFHLHECFAELREVEQACEDLLASPEG